MNEVAVHFSPNQVDAEVAASTLRAYNLHPRVIRDDAMLGVTGGMSVGRFAILVPEREAPRAREVLDEPIREEREDNPVMRLLIIVAIITGLLLATPFVAQVCSGPV
ncbi:MAG: hypothetical protein AABM32_09765 [Chloroflexota bacterium]